MRTFTKIMYCGKCRSKYEAQFEERTPGKWYCISCTPVKPPAPFQSWKGKFTKALSSLMGEAAPADPQPSEASVHIDGHFYSGGKHVCPYCESTHWIACGCNDTWFCWNGKDKSAVCPTCRQRFSTENLGVITGAEGSSGKTQKDGNAKNALGDSRKDIPPTPPKGGHTL